MRKILIDETITFVFAFAFIMPWTAIMLAHDTVATASVFVYESGIVHVASAASFGDSAVRDSGIVSAGAVHHAFARIVDDAKHLISGR